MDKNGLQIETIVDDLTSLLLKQKENMNNVLDRIAQIKKNNPIIKNNSPEEIIIFKNETSNVIYTYVTTINCNDRQFEKIIDAITNLNYFKFEYHFDIQKLDTYFRSYSEGYIKVTCENEDDIVKFKTHLTEIVDSINKELTDKYNTNQ